MLVHEGTLQDVASYWLNLLKHMTRSTIMITVSLDKKYTLVTVADACL